MISISGSLSGNDQTVNVEHIGDPIQAVAAGGGSFSFTGVGPNDKVKFEVPNNGTASSAFNVSGTLSGNGSGSVTLSLKDQATNAILAEQTVPAGGGSYSFTGVLTAQKILLS